ncbi:MAG TPA: acyloxyacyl hydrolase [Candidatus Aquabacterium excrementipullorum]|nr:acyloxyacyl hydrolase [Candidatus Aquabacterium excrementipullorum]
MNTTWPIVRPWRNRYRARIATLLLFTCPLAAICHAAETSPDRLDRGWGPSSVFIQAGHAPASSSIAVGVTWDGPWQRRYALGKVTSLWEVSASRWHAQDEAPGQASWFTQFSLTPAWRLYPHRWSSGWFVEAGVGISAISPRYRTRTKEFGTVFNFNEHLALGKRLADRHEVSLRVQHVSNAGIKEPNPGETFLQVRYAYAF